MILSEIAAKLRNYLSGTLINSNCLVPRPVFLIEGKGLFLLPMKLHFYKYQGAGNDFVLADARSSDIQLSRAQIAWLCDRHFGIGADGFMLLKTCPGADFQMVYFNADGNESTMCGNGGRCIAAFAYALGAAGQEMSFMAIDGLHKAVIGSGSEVELHMQDVTAIESGAGYHLLDTGSPHFVQWVPAVRDIDVVAEGRAIRYSDRFMPDGINVNFVERIPEGIRIRTYERGVENETLACGTGVTAAAIASVGDQTGTFQIPVLATGGELSVSFEKRTAATATGIVLRGPACFVFEGNIELPSAI
jgi:diaminopimelate epimerase